MPSNLYDSDFYLWTQAQADALRAADKGMRGSNASAFARRDVRFASLPFCTMFGAK